MATILSEQRSTYGSPYAYYTVEASTSNRTGTTTDITITVSSHLQYSTSTFGTGYGLRASIYLNDNWYDLDIKSTSEVWSGTTVHTKNATFTVPTNATITTLTGVKFKVVRTDGGTSCSLNSTECSNIELPDKPVSIPTVSPSSATLSSTSVTISTNRSSDTYTHTITTKIGSRTIETFTGVGDSKTWTPSLSNYAPYITSSSATCTVTCITYNGSTQIGTPQTTTFTVVIADNVKPTCSISLSEADSTMQSLGWGIYVQNRSRLAVAISASGAYSSIKSYTATANGATYYSNNFTTSILTGNGTVSAYVTDTRERNSNTATEDYSVVSYSEPSITTALVSRCLADGTESDTGTYLKYSFVGSISPVNNNNSRRFRIGYKLKSESSYQYFGTTTDSYIRESNNVVYGGSFLATNDYDIIFEATDSFTTTKINRTLQSTPDLINFNANGKSMAFGKISSATGNDNLLEIAMDTDLQKNITVSGTPLRRYINSYATAYTGATMQIPASTTLQAQLTSIVTNSDFTLRNGRIYIPQGVSRIEFGGVYCGHGSMTAYITVYNSEDTIVAEPNILTQPAGNGYFRASLGTYIYQIDSSQEHSIALYVRGYDMNAHLNDGFGGTATSVWVKIFE